MMNRNPNAKSILKKLSEEFSDEDTPGSHSPDYEELTHAEPGETAKEPKTKDAQSGLELKNEEPLLLKTFEKRMGNITARSIIKKHGPKRVREDYEAAKDTRNDPQKMADIAGLDLTDMKPPMLLKVFGSAYGKMGRMADPSDESEPTPPNGEEMKKALEACKMTMEAYDNAWKGGSHSVGENEEPEPDQKPPGEVVVKETWDELKARSHGTYSDSRYLDYSKIPDEPTVPAAVAS